MGDNTYYMIRVQNSQLAAQAIAEMYRGTKPSELEFIRAMSQYSQMVRELNRAIPADLRPPEAEGREMSDTECLHVKPIKIDWGYYNGFERDGRCTCLCTKCCESNVNGKFRCTCPEGCMGSDLVHAHVRKN